MAKLIPNEIDLEDTRRDGERLVFEWLSDPSIPGIAFYSLLQKNHKHKLIGEIDFLYVCERGLLCIEVKGGQEIFREDGKWFSRNKADQINKISNPFVQAKDCSYALKSYIADTYGFHSPQSHYLIGYAVVFPECRFTGSGNDLVTEVMFDARHSIDNFGHYLDSVFDYWENLEFERHGYSPERLTALQIQQIINLLRGDFSVVPSMSLELQQIERKMLLLTEEQFDLLDITENNPRVIVQGCAGTGKSLLALEKVRECAAKEQNTLYLCFNKNMATYAKHSLNDSDHHYVTVSTFHSLLIGILGRPEFYKKSVKELCQEYLQLKPSSVVYDYIVIDEGQDLLTTDVLEVIDFLLANGLSKGKWVMFVDPNQNIFNQSDEYDFAMGFLRESCSPVVYTLNYNCRNTEQIALRTAALTLVPPAKKLKITGPKVVTRTFETPRDFVSKFKKEISSVIAGGLSAKDIVILSKKKLSNSLLSELSCVCNLNIIERESISDFSKTSLNFYTIQSFKGLESNIVFLVDIDGFSDQYNRSLNYVAMSRAKLLLYVFYPESCRDDYLDTLDKGRELFIDRK